MSPVEAFAACEATVRSLDPDRYFASLFAPACKRPLLFALYAFNHELARASEVAREPIATEIRLQWWREALEGAREGRPRAHPAAVGLTAILSQDSGHGADLESLIDARGIESSSAPFATLAAMESHARATSASLMRVAARLLAGAGNMAGPIDEAGIAYGLAGMLRGSPYYAARGKLFLPFDLLGAESLSSVDVFSVSNSAKLNRVLKKIGLCAFDHLARARTFGVPRALLPAVLPASLVPAYLSRLLDCADPPRQWADVSRLRRQLILLRTALVGHL